VAEIARLREAARAILDAAIAAGDARRLTGEALGRLLAPGDRRRVLVVGAGKASAEMARAVEDACGERVAGGLVVVKERRDPGLRRVGVVEAGHPIPDERGRAAAADILRLAQEARRDDLVACVISGGGSALMPLPVPGLDLADKQAVTRLLLAAGATISDLNAVRKHLSAIKGGQLARAAVPAGVLALLLSDVIGDPLDVIASGPTAPDPTTYADALGVLDRFGVRDRTPPAALAHLESGARGAAPETPKPDDPLFAGVTNVVVGNNALVVDAAAAAARRLGFTALVTTRSLHGEAREAARAFAVTLREAATRGTPVGRPACVIAAGETTVTVRGPGKGGRCQEFALAIAPALADVPDAVVLAAGTDGSDGPTDAAGAVVDPSTARRARAAGLDLGGALADNDAYRVFAALGDLVVTGPTGTNLMDLYVGLLGPVRRSA
jgi:hydroxypyruvate reductase